jgi:Flp pilus assembly protein TadG
MERQRGQTLPLWIGGILVTLALMFFTLNYANMIRWQIRAQNAADAVASGLLAIQTNNWNRMQIMLYASAIEEFRIRRLIDAIVLTANRSGNCQDASWSAQPSPAATGNSCLSDYLVLKTALNRAVTRYSADIQLLHNFTYQMTKSNIEADMQTMLTHIQSHCYNNPNGGGGTEGADCAFNYKINAIGGRTDLLAVAMDGFIVVTPRIVNGTMSGLVNNFNTSQVNHNLWLPEQVDIVSCATILPLVPALSNIIRAVPFTAVGRGAATSVQVMQDWMQPGMVGDPDIASGAAFQASENPTGEKIGIDDNPYFTINYGGIVNTAVPAYRGFIAQVNNDLFSVQMGWWASVPIAPFGVTVVPGTTVSCPVPDSRL